ncbi:MAG: sodium:alanine symporter family protein [Tissierellia bacterium]|nr:sodium:alanine symporter family protein [Tissierellia bacterium]
MDALSVVKSINKVIWDYFLLYGLVGVGIFFTLYLGFPQIRRFGKMFSTTFGGIFKPKAEGEVSSFSALAVAIAAQVGTGNIAGVATAIMTGGPGAIFWMWITGIVGMSTIFAEAVIAQKYRQKTPDGYIGGPAYYMRNGLKNKSLGRGLAAFFAIAIILALGLIGNMVQSNSISQAVFKAANERIPLVIIGIIIAVLAALVFIGGLQRIANFATLVVPIMAIIYIIFGVVILVKFRAQIGPVFSDIFSSAFSGKAAVGGALGFTVRQAMQKGVARGLFSNEAGMGSTPHAHASARVDHPAEQGFTAMMGVLVDTGVVCTFTALIILLTGANLLGLEGAQVTQAGFEEAFGHIGVILLAVCLAFFAFTTIIGWYYFAETNILYLFGRKGLRPFQLIVVAFIILGSMFKVELVWELADMFNGIMAIPNLIALILLSSQIKEIAKDYKKCEKEGLIHYDYLQ